METNVNWSALLKEAVEKPGIISEAYTAFHDYSFGNQMLAMVQCLERGLKPGPIATYQRWKERNRWVKKGEKALTLCMPVTVKVKNEEEEDEARQLFIYRPRWFVIAQTEGEDFSSNPHPDWDYKLVLKALDIQMRPFEKMDGNCQGYALGREIAINPVAEHPTKTIIHELAHVVLGHTLEGQHTDDERTPRNIREVEAEGVTYIILSLFGLPGVEFSRGYIQHWARGEEISDKSSRRIFTAADKIFKAGQPTTPVVSDPA